MKGLIHAYSRAGQYVDAARLSEELAAIHAAIGNQDESDLLQEEAGRFRGLHNTPEGLPPEPDGSESNRARPP